ncbi:MAG TPA: hypothetical protein VFX70_05840 [Mycobacteriales bacterium]|nr:hypothetical protein [Mycobacteriales bacterium]
MMSEDLPAGTRRRSTYWFHELADEMSDVDGTAVVWLTTPGETARPLVLPRPRRPEDGYRSLGN